MGCVSLEIGGGTKQAAGLLLKEPYCRVAGVAEQPASEPRLVVVIDVEVLQEKCIMPPVFCPGTVPPRLRADRASPGLPM